MPKGARRGPATPDNSEYLARKLLIDKALEAAGWPVLGEFEAGRRYESGAVEEHPTSSGPADYVLFHRGRALAAVEGKKRMIAPRNVLNQALRYSRDFRGGPFDFGGAHLPFIYSTNGEKVCFRDLRRGASRSRDVARFHTPGALEEMLELEAGVAEADLAALEPHPTLRPYQVEAIQAIEAALLKGQRKCLVAMATGTGKTVMTVSLIHRLMKAKVAKRVLFLVDRRALAAQARAKCAEFESSPGLKFDREYEVYNQSFRREDLEDDGKPAFDSKVLPTAYLTNPKPSSAFVYVSTIQRMRINLFGREGLPFGPEAESEADAGRLDIPIHAFDLVVADECHRGYTAEEASKWRAVLDHFDAATVGLTATPAAHTAAHFGAPVYRYDFDRAVREGFLVDYDAVAVRSGVTMNGVFLKEGEAVGKKSVRTGQLSFDILEDERRFDPSDLEREITVPDRNRKIVQEVVEYALEHEKATGRFPKTLVFAANDLEHVSHADSLVEFLCDEIGRGDDFVAKITGSPNVDRPLQAIRHFRNRPEPAVVVTVDMLSTGVDIPAIEFIVLLRPLKSRILFEQMLGRGTRLCPEIAKEKFTVFDCFGGTLIEYFRQATSITAEPPAPPARRIREVVSDIADNRDRAYNTRVLVKRLQRVAKAVSAEGRAEFAAVLACDIADFARTLPDRLDRDFAGTMKVLTNERFLDLAENPKRADAVLLVASEVEDSISSDYLFRTIDGRAMKIPDYIIAFERFVRENPDKIDAIRVLLDRPAHFKTQHLKELRDRLTAQPERFSEPRLRRAYGNDLADIISIVRHAARGEPLLSARDRVARAMATVRAGRVFTPEQEEWLSLIEAHLAENLVIEREDFKVIPFSRRGAWARANRTFDGRLGDLLDRINEAMASAAA